MADSHLAVFNYGNSQNTRHPSPGVTRLSHAEYFVVRHRDGFTNAVFQAPSFSLEPGSHPFQSDLRRPFASCLAANAINHKENASLGIEVETILIVCPQKARMRFACASKCS